MSRFVFDIESSPVPDDPRLWPGRLWIVVARDLDQRGQQLVATWPDGLTREQAQSDPLFQRVVDRLFGASELAGHNIAGFDIPFLEWFSGRRFRGNIFDTFSVSHLTFIATLANLTASLSRARKDRDLMAYTELHSLEGWGRRLGIHKKWADVDTSFFEKFSPEMLERCKSDVAINEALYDYLLTHGCIQKAPASPIEVMWMESEFAYWMEQQRRFGVQLDMEAARKLDEEVRVEKIEAEAEVRQTIPTMIVRNGKEVVPKKDRRMKPTEERPWPAFYAEGAAYQKIDIEPFNPGSDPMLGKTLIRLGWIPDEDEYTEGGQPQVADEILQGLEPYYTWLKPVRKYRAAKKLLGQLSDGAKAWCQLARKRGGDYPGVSEIYTLHGKVKNVGCRTSRCSHTDPNNGQVPKTKNKKDPNDRGRRCRSLYRPPVTGWLQVGWDASQLELRMLANRLYPIDGGAFDLILKSGDMHTEFRKATGLYDRENQKTFTYAFLYGAQGKKLGETVIKDISDEIERNPNTEAKLPPRTMQKAMGERAMQGILGTFPALGELLARLLKVYEERGYIRLLDGAVIKMGSEHSRLNDLLQGDGARVMKWATVIFARKMEARFGHHGGVWGLLLNVHDEVQTGCSTLEVANFAAEAGPLSIKEAGILLGVKVELGGEAKIGRHWGETH